MASTMVHSRVNLETKVLASKILEEMGLTLSDGIRVFLTRLAQKGGMSFDLTTPNIRTLVAMKELEDRMEKRKARVTSPMEPFDAIAKKRFAGKRIQNSSVNEAKAWMTKN